MEELKEDVIARKCRVNVTDIEGLALLLSNITKSLADLKGGERGREGEREREKEGERGGGEGGGREREGGRELTDELTN